MEECNLEEFLHHADLCIESADRLLRAILNLSRLEVGGLKPEVKPVDVWELLSELQREFEGDAREKGLTLRVLPARVWVQSDASLLRSVLQNLLSNAIRYTRTGGVLVGCRNDSDGVRFEVRDSGPGIPMESRKTIFEEFVRLPEGMANGPGAGLGLSIVERVCKLLGHPLKVRSSAHGSTFTVSVPRAEAPARVPVLAATGKLPPGLRILYAENEISVLQSMEALLTRLGASVSTAASLEEARSLKGNWDIILADFHLDEEGDGIDMIEAMSDRARFFALLTANPSEEMIKRAARLNIEIIQKPVSALFLRTFLARAGYLAAAE
jgi:CheY-like chemotaxis protein/anti-sigma regulatory factor (Ser/Thr protein kinase)